MANKQKYGKWKVEKAIRNNRCFKATLEDGTKGAIKIGRGIDHEVKILKYLNHPNIIELLDHDLEAETPYMVTEFFEGRNIKHSHYKGKTIHELTDIMLDTCEAMAYCIGKGVNIHDIEILANEQNEVRLIDFGSAKIIDRVGDIRKGLKQIHDKLDSMENNILYNYSRKNQKAQPFS